MKRFVKKIAFFVLFSLLLTVAFPVAADPFNVFHWRNVRFTGVEPNKNYIKMRWLLSEPERYDAFLFGSSRVGAIHTERLEGVECYNMTYSMGVPQEHLANLRTLIKKGIVPKRVYLGLDNMSYMESAVTHYSQPFRSSYEYLRQHPSVFIQNFLNPAMTLHAAMDRDLSSMDSGAHIDDYGWWLEYGYTSSYDWEHAIPSISGGDVRDEALEAVREMVWLCHERRIELVVFINPMHELTYTASLDRGLLDFLYRLAQITDYYSFCGLNDVTTDRDNYIDNSHYRAEIGDMMVDRMNGEEMPAALAEEGFGMYVTKDNVGQYLALLGEQVGIDIIYN